MQGAAGSSRGRLPGLLPRPRALSLPCTVPQGPASQASQAVSVLALRAEDAAVQEQPEHREGPLGCQVGGKDRDGGELGSRCQGSPSGHGRPGSSWSLSQPCRPAGPHAMLPHAGLTASAPGAQEATSTSCPCLPLRLTEEAPEPRRTCPLPNGQQPQTWPGGGGSLSPSAPQNAAAPSEMSEAVELSGPRCLGLLKVMAPNPPVGHWSVPDGVAAGPGPPQP